MAVSLAPTFGAGYQAFTLAGLPLNAGLIYTYIAGGTTPQATYTTYLGNVQNANPIVLDADGRTPSEVWMTDGASYRFDVKDSLGNLIKTYDYIYGIQTAALTANLASTASVALGDALVGFKQSNSSGVLTGAVAGTVHTKLQQIVSVKDFGATGDGSTDDTTFIQAAIDYACSIAGSSQYVTTGAGVFFPDGNYKTTAALTIPTGGVVLFGNPGLGARIFTASTGLDLFTVGSVTDATSTYEYHFVNLFLQATSANNTDVIGIHAYRALYGSIRNCVFYGFYESVLGQRMNRWLITGCKTWQARTTQIAKSSFRFLGSASGNGGGIHITDCEFAGGDTLAPSVTGHLYVENIDTLYVTQCHFRDMTTGLLVSPDGTSTKNFISDLMLENCYFDEVWTNGAEISGTIAAGGTYQNITFANCYFRGTGGQATNGIKVSVTDSGAFVSGGGRVKNIKVNGGTIRQFSDVGVQITGATTRIAPTSVSFKGVLFADNNWAGAVTTGSAITSNSDTILVEGCTFGSDHVAATSVVQATFSTLVPNTIPCAAIIGNDFSLVNCTGDPITYTALSATGLRIGQNLNAGVGTDVNRTMKVSTSDATPTVIWTRTIPASTSGRVVVSVQGSDGAIAQYASYVISGSFIRTTAGAAAWLGADPTSDYAARSGGMPNPAVALAFSTNTLNLTVTGIAATAITWDARVELITSK